VVQKFVLRKNKKQNKEKKMKKERKTNKERKKEEALLQTRAEIL